jgi:hypothetical protein
MLDVLEYVRDYLTRKSGDSEKIDHLLSGVRSPNSVDAKDMRELERSLFSERVLGILSFDADRIHRYVFGSSKRRIIEGASLLVKDFNREKVRLLVKGVGLSENAVIYAGGGGGMIWCPVDVSSRLAEVLQKSYSDVTGDGSCTISFFPLFFYEMIWGVDDDRFLYPREIKYPLVTPLPFGRFFSCLATVMQSEKQRGSLSSGKIQQEGWLRRCSTCGVNVAEFKVQDDHLCRFCMKKLERSKAIIKEKNERESALIEDRPGFSFDEIAGMEAGEHGELAVIYADGNAMGKALEKLSSIEHYGVFSESIEKWIKDSFDEAISYMGWGGEEGKKRYIAPILGGDDICAVIPALGAPEFSIKLMNSLRKRKKELEGLAQQLLAPITFSMGLFIAPYSYPLSFLFEEAEGELKKAKAVTYSVSNDNLDGKWVLSFRSISDNAPGRLSSSDEVGKVVIGGYPYHVDEFEELCSSLSIVKRKNIIPRSQLYLLRSVWEGEHPEVAKMMYEYQLTRVSGRVNEKDRVEFNSLLEKLNVSQGFDQSKTYRTRVGDVVDLWNFVEEGKTW